MGGANYHERRWSALRRPAVPAGQTTKNDRLAYGSVMRWRLAAAPSGPLWGRDSTKGDGPHYDGRLLPAGQTTKNDRLSYGSGALPTGGESSALEVSGGNDRSAGRRSDLEDWGHAGAELLQGAPDTPATKTPFGAWICAIGPDVSRARGRPDAGGQPRGQERQTRFRTSLAERRPKFPARSIITAIAFFIVVFAPNTILRMHSPQRASLEKLGVVG